MCVVRCRDSYDRIQMPDLLPNAGSGSQSPKAVLENRCNPLKSVLSKIRNIILFMARFSMSSVFYSNLKKERRGQRAQNFIKEKGEGKDIRSEYSVDF